MTESGLTQWTESRTRRSVNRFVGSLFVLVLFRISACAPGPQPAIIGLLDTLRAEDVAAPWRVLSLENQTRRLARQTEGASLVGARLRQDQPESICRLKVRFAEGGRAVAVVAYQGNWRPDGRVSARILQSGPAAAMNVVHIGEGSAVFEYETVYPGLATIELVHRINQGAMIPLGAVAIGEISADSSPMDTEELGLLMRWMAISEYDTRRSMPDSRRISFSVNGCTRDGIVITENNGALLNMPRDSKDRVLEFWLICVGTVDDRSAGVTLEAHDGSSWSRVDEWQIDEQEGWRGIHVESERLPRNAQRLRFTVTAAGALLGVGEPVLVGSEAGDRRPNLIVIDLDTVRSDRLMSYGYRERPTSARFDSVMNAKGFYIFENAYAPSPWTLSSTAKFFSSRYLHDELRNGTSSISDETPLLAAFMRENGYYCSAFTGGAVLRTPGFERGFHEYHWSKTLGKVEDSFPQASAWLRTHPEPFFLFIHTYEAHSPYTRDLFCRELGLEAREIPFGHQDKPTTISEDDSLYVQALYDGGVKVALDATADFFALMDTLKLWDETIVIVLSDHGEELWEHCGVYARHGHSLYEELLRVPFLVYHPGSGPPSRRIERRVSLVDLVPTVADLLELRWNDVADGRSLTGLMENRALSRGAILASLSNGAPWSGVCLITDSLKYIEMQKNDDGNRSQAFTGMDYPYNEELYSLVLDPWEMTNLLESRPDVVDAFADTLHLAIRTAATPIQNGAAPRESGIQPALGRQLEALGYVD